MRKPKTYPCNLVNILNLTDNKISFKDENEHFQNTVFKRFTFIFYNWSCFKKETGKPFNSKNIPIENSCPSCIDKGLLTKTSEVLQSGLLTFTSLAILMLSMCLNSE